jgi:hypothetical protein
VRDPAKVLLSGLPAALENAVRYRIVQSQEDPIPHVVQLAKGETRAVERLEDLGLSFVDRFLMYEFENSEIVEVAAANSATLGFALRAGQDGSRAAR